MYSTVHTNILSYRNWWRLIQDNLALTIFKNYRYLADIYIYMDGGKEPV